MRTRAITLIELLIATIIFSVVLLSIYTVFNTGILSYNKIDDVFNTYQEARRCISKIDSDLKNSFSYGDDSVSFIAEEDNLEFFTVAKRFKGGFSIPEICRIKYQLTSAGLMRVSFCGLNINKTESQDSQELLLPNIRKVSFQYAFYNDNSKNDPVQWRQSWAKEGNSKITKFPFAVKTEIIISQTNKSNQLSFVKISPLPLAEYLNEEEQE